MGGPQYTGTLMTGASQVHMYNAFNGLKQVFYSQPVLGIVIT